jgi:energy-coupling factor transporter ATP-binding protein EcfA2
VASGLLRERPLSLLLARDLSVTPPGAQDPAVRGVSVSLRPGTWIGLAGPNGSGKTSLLLGLAGLWPAAGELLLDGEPYGPGSPPDRRRTIAVIQQDPASQLLQGTVYDELAFAPRNLGVSEEEIGERIRAWAGRLGLEEDLAADPGRLSAGRQQLVLLAAALVARPSLLLADEPTAHVDAGARRRVLDVVREEVGKGLGVLWATQSEEELAAADEALALGGLRAVPGLFIPMRETDSDRKRLRVRILPRDEAAAGPRVNIDRALAVEVPSAGLLALSGANGIGKSVILSAIAGLAPVPQVEVTWSEPNHPPPIIALQFPELQIFQEVVSDEIAYASVSRGVARDHCLAQANNLLRTLQFDPEDFLSRRTWSLSMGAKRIMEVIGAIVAPASLVLLDEPSAGLDPERSARLAIVLGEAARTRPIVMATHDGDWLERMGIPAIAISPIGSAKTPIGDLKTH